MEVDRSNELVTAEQFEFGKLTCVRMIYMF